MSYRKFKADYLFDGYKLHKNQEVLITLEDGTVQDIVDRSEAGEGVESLKGLISPGFVNCHCHLELSHLKGMIPMKTGLVRFVLSVIGQRKADREKIGAAIVTAEENMLASGIVAVGDICNTTDTLMRKPGSRLLYYHFMEIAGWLPAQAQDRFDTGKLLYDAFAEMEGSDNHLSISPHAPYSVSADLWDLLKPGFPHKTISIHNQETAAEDHFFISGEGELKNMYAAMKIDNPRFHPPGTRSLPHYLHHLESAENILLVHNTFTTEEDLIRAAAFSPRLFFCLCPNANLYIENTLPDIPAMINAGGQMVLGTDSLASNHQLSVLEEMKTIKKHFPLINTSTLLQWATSNGARALQYEHRLGDFKAGKKPGIVLIEYPGQEPLGEYSRSSRIL
jgi:cytosine/adenosine deaminase-related metal-dependent hydrolase